MKLKRLLVPTICLISVLNSNLIHTSAMMPVGAGAGIAIATNVGGMIAGYVPQGLGVYARFNKYRLDKKDAKEYEEERKKYSGYRSKNEIASNLLAICEGKSQIKIYGQNKAKEDCYRFLIVALEEIFNNKKSCESTSGNVVYIIGPPGTGKSVMANAIADAFLKYKEHTCLIISPEQAKSDSSSGPTGDLASRLFKVITKFVNLEKKPKDPGFFEVMLNGDQIKQNCQPSMVLAPIPYHLFKWSGEAVIILDDYDKMKLEKNPFNGGRNIDKSADEVFRSIVSNGYYMVNGEKIDCSKALFIITSNETKEEIYQNFGEGGVVGGAPRRLSIAEFKGSDDEFGGKLVSNMISEIRSILMNESDIYKIKNIRFSEETIRRMADYVTNNKLKQGGAIKDLRSVIFDVCSKPHSKLAYKSIELLYEPNDNPDEVGDFTVRILEKGKKEVKTVKNSKTKTKKKKNSDFEVCSDDGENSLELNSDDGEDF